MLQSNEDSYVDQQLQSEHFYRYRIRYFTLDAKSEWSPAIIVGTPEMISEIIVAN